MYNNPNFYGYNPMYYSAIPRKTGLFSKLISNFNFSSFLNNTSKTLNVINQAIPIFYQVKPLFQNAKVMFKIADILKSDDNSNKNNSTHNNSFNTNKKDTYKVSSNEQQHSDYSNNQPTFFL